MLFCARSDNGDLPWFRLSGSSCPARQEKLRELISLQQLAFHSSLFVLISADDGDLGLIEHRRAVWPINIE